MTVDAEGTVRWYDDDGLPHNSAGPAVQYSDGGYAWMRHGRLHRADGPAHVSSGFPLLFLNEELRRVGAPVICSSMAEWFHQGQRHRADGPAVVLVRGEAPQEEEWWLYGTNVTAPQHAAWRSRAERRAAAALGRWRRRPSRPATRAALAVSFHALYAG